MKNYNSAQTNLLKDKRKSYDTKIDLWSSGCIIYELMSYQTGLNQGQKHKYLFPGASCFPLSPSSKSNDEYNENIVSKSDQMKVILDTIGKQDE